MPDISPTVTAWLLASDPSIRWQVLRDLLDKPESDWEGEREKIETEGWGKQLFSCQDEDGQWAGGAFAPKDATMQEFKEDRQPFTGTAFVLTELRDMGLEPESAGMKKTVDLTRVSCIWEHDKEKFWDGEVEECINGRLVADGCYFGIDMTHVVDRLLETQLEDGGWNCERENGSKRSSFDSTISVLEGLLEYEKLKGGSARSKEARKKGEEYLLTRNLFRRQSTGEVVKERYLQFKFPPRADYDILRAMDYFRMAAGFDKIGADPRLKEATERIRSRQNSQGQWVLDRDDRGRRWLDVNDGIGQPSRWITLRALRVLKWWDNASP
ncbi:hypothetical protein NLG97_g149 [Lecanicillium saksenae]|uniref:Uncharacterized protein n=1 Tax=Lecanicillium saksenae TaxID=468837 RepID=A0ACC1RA33_9HYPO|nr:hypothetical protein NLG97_g149 [Lecanicillium saksenae]